jgi:hypothetical protein
VQASRKNVSCQCESCIIAASAILSGREFAQLHVDCEVLVTPGDMHRHCLTGVLADERIPQCRNIIDGSVINLHNHIPRLQPSLSRRPIGSDTHNKCAMIDSEVVLRGKPGIHARHRHAQRGSPRVRDLARLDQLWHNELHAVGGDRKADAGQRSRPAS